MTESVESAARLALTHWTRVIGTTGMAAMRQVPGLLADVDQHVTQIRRSVVDAAGRLHAVTLAAYADGVADAVTARGWSAQETGAVGWHRASWPSVHLLAVCVLAESAV